MSLLKRFSHAVTSLGYVLDIVEAGSVFQVTLDIKLVLSVPAERNMSRHCTSSLLLRKFDTRIDDSSHLRADAKTRLKGMYSTTPMKVMYTQKRAPTLDRSRTLVSMRFAVM